MTANDEMGGMWKEVSLPISKVTSQHLLAVKTNVGKIQNQSLKLSHNQSHIMHQALEIYTELWTLSGIKNNCLSSKSCLFSSRTSRIVQKYWRHFNVSKSAPFTQTWHAPIKIWQVYCCLNKYDAKCKWQKWVYPAIILAQNRTDVGTTVQLLTYFAHTLFSDTNKYDMRWNIKKQYEHKEWGQWIRQ